MGLDRVARGTCILMVAACITDLEEKNGEGVGGIAQ
jgi:hypothetical protein